MRLTGPAVGTTSVTIGVQVTPHVTSATPCAPWLTVATVRPENMKSSVSSFRMDPSSIAVTALPDAAPSRAVACDVFRWKRTLTLGQVSVMNNRFLRVWLPLLVASPRVPATRGTGGRTAERPATLPEGELPSKSRARGGVGRDRDRTEPRRTAGPAIQSLVGTRIALGARRSQAPLPGARRGGRAGPVRPGRAGRRSNLARGAPGLAGGRGGAGGSTEGRWDDGSGGGSDCGGGSAGGTHRRCKALGRAGSITEEE